MKILAPIALIALLTACGPSPSTDSTESQTTKTTTTETTTSTVPTGSPAATGVAAAPLVAPTTLTQANLDRVSNDMSQAEVEAIFGAPTSSSTQPIPIVGGTQTTFNYQSGNSAVTIIFKNNQVKEKNGTFNP